MKISVAELRWLAESSTISEIADMTEARYNTTWNRLKTFGIKPRHARAGTGMRWTVGEDNIIRSGMAKGLKARDIAKQLKGRNKDMVLGRWFRIKGGK